MENQLILLQIFKFVESNMQSRCLTEAEQILTVNHLVMCGIKSKDDNSVQIEAVCIRSTSIKENPHILNCALRKKINEWSSLDIECYCIFFWEGKKKHSC